MPTRSQSRRLRKVLGDLQVENLCKTLARTSIAASSPTEPVSKPQQQRTVKRRPQKRVQFEDSAPTIHIIPVYYDTDDDDDDETATGAAMGARTCDLTIISTVHGRERRMLRDITKQDLQNSMKYGVKTPGKLCPWTGKNRWHYSYGGIVYVTDPSSQVEITSFWSYMNDIRQAVITPQLREQHNRQKTIIKAHPMACQSHTIVIMDQCEPMEYTMPCLPSRPHSIFGVLALEYVARELHSRENGNRIGSATAIDMQDYASLLLDDEPMDWILFNTLLSRQYTATASPGSCGSYNQAFGLARDLITQKLSQADEYSAEDLPVLTVIYMTDGKRSFNYTQTDLDSRSAILGQLALQLGQHLTFTAIALGAPGTNYDVLSTMVATLRDYNVDTNVQFAHQSTAYFCRTLSSETTTTIRTRESKYVDMLTLDPCIPASRPTDSDKSFKSYTHDVWRWRFDVSKDKANIAWPLQKVGFSSSRTVGFQIAELPFGKGRERHAYIYMFHEIDADGQRVGKLLVAKDSISSQTLPQKQSFHLSFCHDQAVAQQYATKFNRLVGKNAGLEVIGTNMSPPKISFLECYLYEYVTEHHDTACLLVEAYLNGKFTKYNANNGYVRRKCDKPISLAIDDAHLYDFLQAFSHWTYVDSGGELLICDLQGILNEEGVNPKFELTDPCICRRRTTASSAADDDGCCRRTDMGMAGIQSFFRTHQCNPVCRALGLR